jgi:uncharacterized protein
MLTAPPSIVTRDSDRASGPFMRGAIFVLLLIGSVTATANQPTPAGNDTQTLTVFVGGRAIGSEEVTVVRGSEGWTITSTGTLGAPLDLITRRLVVRYDAEWHPLELTIDAASNAEPLSVHTTFDGTSASSEISQSGQSRKKTDTVSRDTIVMPNLFFATLEALAARLSRVTPPAELKGYIAPQIEVPIQVKSVTEDRLQVASQTLTARRYAIAVGAPSGSVEAEVSVDAAGRLMRFRVPAQSVDVVRQQLASVSSRTERVSRANDETTMIPGNGFSLAATISKPAQPPAKMPAVVLVAGSGPVDRDETVTGIPIFGLLASALADAGFLVVRYDKRGVGQSGGRLEAATLSDYAEDARAAVRYLSSRKDVDSKRIGMIGHSEGGWVALIAGSRDDRIRAIALVATPGTAGAELVLEQQQHQLAKSTLSQGERQTATDLQKKILQAVIAGDSWDGIPPEVRRRVDTPWYRSLLMFDPAPVIEDVDQPLLIVQGELDTQVPPHHADKLLAMARARRRDRTADIQKVPGVNHLMVPARTGEVSEYATLEANSLSAEAVTAVANWLQQKLPALAK